jgi:hypothetical protein
MTARTALIALMSVCLLGASGATAASERAAAPPAPNDGLPTTWYGITKWTSGLPGPQGPPDSTIAHVTLTLATKKPYLRSAVPPAGRAYYIGAAGTSYLYRPRGTITVTGQCETPVKGSLKPVDGALTIEVEKSTAKVRRAVYFGGDAQTLQADIPQACPNGISPYPGGPSYWGFQTTTQYNPLLRKLSTSATKISGTFHDPNGIHSTYDWCFVRSARNLLACSYVVLD